MKKTITHDVALKAHNAKEFYYLLQAFSGSGFQRRQYEGMRLVIVCPNYDTRASALEKLAQAKLSHTVV